MVGVPSLSGSKNTLKTEETNNGCLSSTTFYYEFMLHCPS